MRRRSAARSSGRLLPALLACLLLACARVTPAPDTGDGLSAGLQGRDAGAGGAGGTNTVRAGAPADSEAGSPASVPSEPALDAGSPAQAPPTCAVDTSGGGVSGGVDEDCCRLPWFGSSVERAKGLLHCPEPDDPAILTFGQSQHPACWTVTGPIDERVSREGLLSCEYHLDEHPCGMTFETDFTIDVPYFGDGSRVTELPSTPVPDPSELCAAPVGAPLSLGMRDKADALVGIWLACGPIQEPFVGDGFVFRGDGTFHAITRLQDGRLVESDGCNQGGLWGMLHESQLNLHANEFLQPLNPTFVGSLDRLTLDVYVAIEQFGFVRVTSE